MTDDGTERLCQALYGRKATPRDYLGGSNAKMLHDAADRILAGNHNCPMCGYSPSSGAEPVWHPDPGIVERAGKFVILIGNQVRLFDVLWAAMKGRSGPLVAARLAGRMYSNEPHGGPLSFKTIISNTARDVDQKLQPIGMRVRAESGRGYRLTFSEVNHEMVA